MMWPILLPVILIIFALSCMVIYLFKHGSVVNTSIAMVNHLSRIEDFCTTQKVIGYDGCTGIAIDEQKKKVCLLDHRQETVSFRVISYKDLLSAELFEDGSSVTKTVRSGLFGGGLIGGIALGGVGVIMGGLSGKTQTSGRVKKIDLRLIINNTENPLHDVNFLNLEVEVEKDNRIYPPAMQKARHWHGLIQVLIGSSRESVRGILLNS